MKFGELLGVRALETLSRRQTSKDAQAARLQQSQIAAGATRDAAELRAAVRETPQQQLMKEYTAAVESGDPKQIDAVKAKVEFFQSTNPGFARTDQAAAAAEQKGMLGSKAYETYQMLKSIPNPSQTFKDQIAAKELELKAQFPNAFKGGAGASTGPVERNYDASGKQINP
jgi:transposase